MGIERWDSGHNEGSRKPRRRRSSLTGEKPFLGSHNLPTMCGILESNPQTSNQQITVNIRMKQEGIVDQILHGEQGTARRDAAARAAHRPAPMCMRRPLTQAWWRYIQCRASCSVHGVVKALRVITVCLPKPDRRNRAKQPLTIPPCARLLRIPHSPQRNDGVGRGPTNAVLVQVVYISHLPSISPIPSFSRSPSHSLDSPLARHDPDPDPAARPRLPLPQRPRPHPHDEPP